MSDSTNSNTALNVVPQDQQVFKANKLNSLIDRIWFQSPLYWNSHKYRWEFLESKTMLYLTSHIGLKIFYLFTCLMGLFAAFQDPNFFSNIQRIAISLFSTCLVLCICGDLLICLEGREILIVVNWCYQKAAWLTEHGSHAAIRNFGLFVTINCLSVALAGITIGFVGVYIQIAPLLFYLKYLKIQNLSYTTFDVISVPYLVLVITSCYRTICITALVDGFYKIHMLKTLAVCRPTEDTIKIYKENIVAMQLMFSFSNKAIAAALTGTFFGLLLSANALMLANLERSAILLGLALLISTVFFVLLQVQFAVGCSFFETSVQVLAKWRCETGGGFRGKELKRVVKSLQVIQLPVGNIGIVDKDIKDDTITLE